MSYVYLIHFDRPISPKHTTQHYIGTADNIPARMQQHMHGNGARLTAVAAERGISFKLVRAWRGGRALERRLKRGKNAPLLCPICNPQANHRETKNALSPEELQAEQITF